MKYIPGGEAPSPSEPPAVARSKGPANRSPDVFIVHGHDQASKHEVARFLESTGLNVIILHERADKGRTIIEKLEEHNNPSLAIVLLTPDDLGGMASSPSKLNPRARQNVVFEMGFFVGRLGRSRVIVLHSPGVEIPTDYQGVLYIPLGREDAWKLKLAQELRSAGMTVDLSRIA
ncbi:MAG TPA: nucleotide-binding protein [Candidatus Bathyarchaeia archaeon]|nr:nucleotide-binding protein [Candidatus Bathyarchaeia archaeon]